MAKTDNFDNIENMDEKILPPGHTFVPTDDGSFTLYSETFGEACHSTAGAKTETILHYVNGCKIPEKVLTKRIVILEVGFGLGVGFLTTLEMIKSPFTFISLELDRNLLDWFKEQHPDLNLQWKDNLLTASSPQFELIIIHGNARTALPEFLKFHSYKWDAIYQDAFSPKRNPVLWTKEWFTLLKEHSDDEVILSTYSASSSIRKSMHEAGWGVNPGEQFGKKRTSTRAYLNKETHPEILLQLERSPVAAFTDSALN